MITTLVIRDVTARKQAEKAQAASRARFEAIFNSISDAVIFVDQERRMALLNPAVEALFGYPPEELLGRTTEILYADPAEYVRQGNLRYREDASANQTRSEIKYRRRDGTVSMPKAWVCRSMTCTAIAWVLSASTVTSPSASGLKRPSGKAKPGSAAYLKI